MAAAHVQTAWNEVASATSLSITITTTAGNKVVLCFCGGSSLAGMGTITQTAGDTLTAAGSAENSGGTYTQQYVTPAAIAGGSTTYTMGWTNAQNAGMYVTEVSGTNASPADVSASTAFSSGTTISSGTTATLAQADEIAVAVWNCDGSGSTTITSTSNSFTVPTNGNQVGAGHTGARAVLAYKVVAATTAVETTLTTGDTITGTGLVVTYKGVVAGVAWTVIGRTVLDYGE